MQDRATEDRGAGPEVGAALPLPSEPLPSEPLPSEPLPSEPLPSEPLPSEPLALVTALQEPTRYTRVISPAAPSAPAPPPEAAVTRAPKGGRGLGQVAAALAAALASHEDVARQDRPPEAELTLSGGLRAALAAPLAVCALAEDHVLRRVRGSSAAALSAAAAATAELGRAAAGTGAGFAGLAGAVAWLSGDDGGPTSDPGWRLARLFQPASTSSQMHRLMVAAFGPQFDGEDDGEDDGDGRRRWRPRRGLRLLAAALAGLEPGSWIALVLAWLGAVLGCAGMVTALARAHQVSPALLPLAALLLIATFALAATFCTTLVAAQSARLAYRAAAAQDGWGVIAGAAATVPVPRSGGLRRRLERWAGVLDPGDSPHLLDWVAERLDDLAGAAPVADGVERYAVTFGELWLGRLGTRSTSDLGRLRAAVTDPDLRTIDLVLTAGDLSDGRAARLPFGAADGPEPDAVRYLFCRDCLLELVPVRVADQMVLMSPQPSALRCPRHDTELLHHLPEPWDLPVVFAVRLAIAAPGLLRAIPLYRSTGDHAAVRTHWFGAQAPTAGPPTGVIEDPTSGRPRFSLGPEPDAAEPGTSDRPLPGVADLIAAVLRSSRSEVQPFLSRTAILRLGLAGYRTGAALARRDHSTGPAEATQAPASDQRLEPCGGELQGRTPGP